MVPWQAEIDVLLLLLVLSQISGTSAPAPKRPPETVILVEQAKALPAEFRADTLLHLESSQLIQETKWKQELIEEAFWAGARAPLPYRQWADRKDSLETRKFRANGLEALSLQARAVEAMLPLDSTQALRMFNMMPPQKFPDLDCSEINTPDVSAYYQVA